MRFGRSSVSLTVIVGVLLLSVRNNAQTPRPPAPAQRPAVRFEGRVVDDETGLGLPNARVGQMFGTADAPPIAALTDVDGRFAFTLPGGLSRIAAVKTGYARGEAETSADGRPVEIRLKRGAAISGRVLDQFGEPVADARVSLEASSNGSSDRRTVMSTTTDDLGEYRLGGLSEGAFLPFIETEGIPRVFRNGSQVLVGASPRVRTYYPRVATADEAQSVPVHPGEERQGIDFLLTAAQITNQPYAVNDFFSRLPIDFDDPPPGNGVIRGRITSADGGGLSQARVMLELPSSPGDRMLRPRVLSTLPDGRFEFSNLAPGRYRMRASKSGFLPATTSGTVIGLQNSSSTDGPAQTPRDGIDIPLTRFGTITGRVLDEYGFPLMGARVQALHLVYEGGRRRLTAVGLPGRTTDDRGAYRLYGLQPGQYMVAAFIGDVSSDDVPGYARTYFPGMESATNAQFVAVAAGHDVVGLDFPMVRTRTARVSGRRINSQGQPGGGALVLMPTWRATTVPGEPIGARIQPQDGRFEFRNVPPGDYVLQSGGGKSNRWTESEFAAMSVSVNGADVSDLVLQTTRGSTVSGVISFNTLDRTRLPPAGEIVITAVPVDPDLSPGGGWAEANILSNWQFQMGGLSGARRLIATRLPAGWTLEQIRVGGIDVTDRPLSFGRADQPLTGVEIILSDRISQLSGTVTDDESRPVRGAHVIVFAADRDRWFSGSRFLRGAIADEQGAYTVSGLPFGSYYVTALAQPLPEGPDAWQDPAFLTTQMSRAASLTISEGQRVTRAIRVSAK
jgi:protocatechuate 3,4-dioxygenase beta subunit